MPKDGPLKIIHSHESFADFASFINSQPKPTEWSLTSLFKETPLELPKLLKNIKGLRLLEVPVTPEELKLTTKRMEAPAKPYTSIVGVPENKTHKPFHVMITSAIHNGDAGVQNPTGENGEVRAIALGGIRITGRENPVEEALGLSMAMTYKWDALMAFLEFMRNKSITTQEQVDAARMGGMKTVIKASDQEAFDAMTDEEKAYFWSEVVATHFNLLDGRGTAAPDMGTSSEIMDKIAKNTNWVACTTETTGNPSPVTAAGVWDTTKKMITALEKDQILEKEVSFAIQGIGHVGQPLLENILIDNPKATIYVTDKPEERARVELLIKQLNQNEKFPEARIIFVETNDIFSVPAQVFIPCAGPQVLNEENLEKLARTNTVRLLVSAANDPYPLDEAGRPKTDYIDRLYNIGIVAPAAWTDNMGGIASIALGLEAMNFMKGLGDWIVEIYKRAKIEKRSMEYVSIDIIHEYHAALCKKLGLLDKPLIQ